MKPKSLFNINFTLLLQGLMVSQLGSTIYFVAVALWIKDNTSSAAIMGMLGVATFLPGVLSGPIGGTFSDKWSRKKIIVTSDLICGIVPMVIAYLMFFHSAEQTLIVYALFAAAIITSVVSSFFRPAVLASIPSLVPENKIIKANGLINSSFSISMILGQSFAGVLFIIFSVPMLIFINAITYIMSAVSECFIQFEKKDKAKNKCNKSSSFKDDLIEGIHFFKKVDGLIPLTITFASYLFFSSAVVIGLPYYVELQLYEKDIWFGYLLASTGIGLLLGSILATTSIFKLMNKALVSIYAILGSGIAFIIFSMTDSTYTAAIMLILRGAVFGILSVWFPSVIQMSCPDKIRGRIMGLFSSITMAAVPLGYLLSGILIDVLEHNTMPIYFVCGLFTIFSVIPLISNHSFSNLMTLTNYKSSDFGRESTSAVN